jgi:hypothetical protein
MEAATNYVGAMTINGDDATTNGADATICDGATTTYVAAATNDDGAATNNGDDVITNDGDATQDGGSAICTNGGTSLWVGAADERELF